MLGHDLKRILYNITLTVEYIKINEYTRGPISPGSGDFNF